jgi:hypothetical protein
MVHLARTHDIHGIRGRLSTKAVHEFFPLLEKRRWTDAQRFLNKMEDVEDEWIQGYSHALEGMLLALKDAHSSPQPHILEAKEYSNKELQDLKNDFITLSHRPLNTEFDEGYFQGWLNFISHKRNKAPS